MRCQWSSLSCCLLFKPVEPTLLTKFFVSPIRISAWETSIILRATNCLKCFSKLLVRHGADAVCVGLWLADCRWLSADRANIKTVAERLHLNMVNRYRFVCPHIGCKRIIPTMLTGGCSRQATTTRAHVSPSFGGFGSGIHHFIGQSASDTR